MSPIVPEPSAEGRVAGSVEMLGDADPAEGGYGNVYVTIGQGVLVLRARLNSCVDLRLADR